LVHGVADGLLTEFAFGLRRDGWRVQGLIQQERGGRGKSAIMLVDIESEKCYPLFQNLGSGSGSCGLDQSSVAAASIVLRQALDQRPDLAVANRFGALEASGGGLASEMLHLMAADIPLVTVVPNEYLTHWRSFTGYSGVELPPELEALQDWFAALNRRR
jgi:nucleoside-triphosphatase THEP1